MKLTYNESEDTYVLSVDELPLKQPIYALMIIGDTNKIQVSALNHRTGTWSRCVVNVIPDNTDKTSDSSGYREASTRSKSRKTSTTRKTMRRGKAS